MSGAAWQEIRVRSGAEGSAVRPSGQILELVAEAKALTVLPEGGTTEVVPDTKQKACCGRVPGLHDEGQVLQFFLHAIEIAAHFFEAADGVASSGSAHTISAPGEEAT